MARFVLASVFCGLILVSCSPVGNRSDEVTVSHLDSISRETSEYYVSLIRTYGSADCQRSAKISKNFWQKIDGDMRVIETRAVAIESNKSLRNAVIPLRERYQLAEEQVDLAERVPSRKPDGSLNYCLEPIAAAQTSDALLRELGSVKELASFNLFSQK